MRRVTALATQLGLLVLLTTDPALATEIRYDFEIIDFRESMSPFAPFERMTGYYRADVDYSTAVLNSFIEGAVSLHEGGPTIAQTESYQDFGTWRFHGSPGGIVLDWTGGVDDFTSGFDIFTGGVLSPRFQQPGTSYTIASTNGIWSHDSNNGSSSIRVTVPDDQTVTVGTPTTRYEQLRQLILGERSWVNFQSSEPVVIDNDLSTNRGGIGAIQGFRYGGDTRRNEVLGWWNLSNVRKNMAKPLENQASDMLQAQNIFAQMGAEADKSQMQRWQIQSDLQTRIHEITAKVTRNKAIMAAKALNGITQYISSSTIDGDMDFLGHFVVGGDPTTEGFDTTTVLGNFTTQPLSTFNFDLHTSGHDQMVVEGAVHLGELNQFFLNLADDGTGRYLPEYADSFDLIVADVITSDGILPVVDEYMPSDLMWLLGIVDLPGDQQALRAIVGVSRVPEPASILMLASFGAMGILWRRLACESAASVQ